MGKFIKLLSKLHKSILILLTLVVFASVFFFIPYFFIEILAPVTGKGGILALAMLVSWALALYGTYRFILRLGKQIAESINDSNDAFISNTDIPELCIDMLEAVLKKYRYINYEHKLATYFDWMEFQAMNERSRMMSGVIADELQLKKLDQMAKNYILGNPANEDLKELKEYESDKSFIVTFDNVPIARNKFLNWLFNTNRIVVDFFGSGSAIEINLLSQANYIDFNFNHFQIRIKITTKDMEKRGKHELTELRFALDDEDKPKYEEMVMMHMPLFSYTEKEMEISDTVEIIKFMQKFIRNTRKLIRQV